MSYELKCKGCGAKCWARGEYDPETNALELNEDDVWEWEPAGGTCAHEECEIVNQQDEWSPMDDL